MTRVAAYCRVSTDKADQTHSFNSQKAFFSQYIASRQDWILTEIYADEGITGTTTAERSGFLKMIDDASHRKFEIIVTKEVSRFSRNLLDAISFTRQLKEMGVGVIFLNDSISTLDSDAELRLGIMAAVAQEESRKTSERVKWGQLRQMERGVVFGRSLLGYDVTNGKLTIEPEGAETVRRIFSMYLTDRMGVRAIAKSLTEKSVPTKSGGVSWSGAAVLKIIRNEKYCGDLIQKKTVTTDYLTHKKKKNDGKDLIHIRNHHEPIVEREAWEAAQAELKRRSHQNLNTVSGGNKYALSGKIICAGCGSTYNCRTRERKNGSVYRAWSCLRCSCREKRGQIREEDLVQSVRHIIALIGIEILTNGLGGIVGKALKEQDAGEKEYEKRILLTERKKIKLIDSFLTGDVNREEYHILKTQYDEDITKLKILKDSSCTYCGEPKLTQLILSLAAGKDDDDDFYLSLVNRIKVLSINKIEIFMLNSDGKWTVEFY